MTGRMPAEFGALDTAASRQALDDGEFLVIRWGYAPTNLMTVRQLAARGLRPGGHEPVGVIRWRRGQRVAYLYDSTRAVAKRPPTPANLAALDRAMAARRRCQTCGNDAGYCVPLRTRQCGTCMAADEQ